VPLFQRALRDVSVGPGDQVYALGDGEVRVFAADGRAVGRWPAPDGADCLTVAADGRVWTAGAGRVDAHDAAGVRTGGFAVGDAANPASLTAIRVAGGDVLVADASARLVRRFETSGRLVNRIGDQNKTRAFILPNGRLDLAVGADGTVVATDTGRHRVTFWTLDGSPSGQFGKFGMADPADFVGCCNPVNVAAAPDGTVVTGEKLVPRVKVFARDGRMLGYIGPEHFDRMVTQIHLAVDSRGRIYAGDPVRRTITIFAAGATTEQGHA
jgi:sugar lactone lactonase YvrE